MLSFLLSVVFSVVPARYRRRFLVDPDLNVQRGALVSGVVETVGCALALWLRYPPYVQGRMAEAGAAVAKAGGSDNISQGVAAYSTAGLSLFEYIVQPVSLMLVFFFLEGMARLTAAVVTGEVLPTLPLQLIAWAHRFGEDWKQERDLGPRIVDTVAPGAADYDLRIESCRPKPWNPLTTISYNDQLYEVTRELTGSPPRRFVYLLRNAPESKLVRGLHHYDPEETLQSN